VRQPNPDIQVEAARSAWDAASQPPATQEVIKVRCELVTPMYGGGVMPGEVDCALPIRPTALRGHLRFWWRLLRCTGNGGAFKDEPEALFRAEMALWGGISGRGPHASKVTARIEAEAVGPEHLVAWKSNGQVGPSVPAYALVLERNDNPQLLKAGYAFELALRFTTEVTSEQRDEVIEALRWWASFGGVGARTRRGLGSVRVTSDTVELKPVSEREVGERGGWLSAGHPAESVTAAWCYAVEILRQFRQGKNVGRNPGRGGSPGRSRWPEADTIRRLSGNAAHGHDPTHPVENAYPRAVFGLPIVFHFKDNGDPPDHTLVPCVPGNENNQNRMASPLILRPWFDGQRWRPAALLLPGWEERVSVPVGIQRENNFVSKGKPAWPENLDERDRLATQVEPMKGRGEDALTAFMCFFEKQADSKPPSGQRPKRGR